jgi:hypothetical protein
MANLKISQLTTFTGQTEPRWFVMNDITETTTYKFSGYTSPFKQDLTEGLFSTFGTPAVYAASANYSIGIGSGVDIDGDYAVVIGKNAATATGGESRNVVVGAFSSAGQFGASVGYATQSSASYASCFGHDAQASGQYATVIGAQTRGNGTQAVAVGNFAFAFADDTIAIGQNVTSNNANNITIGNTLTNSGGVYSDLFGGASNTITSSGQYNSILNGNGNTISGSTSGSTMLNTKNRVADADNTIFVENLKTFGNVEVQGQSWVTLPTTGTTTSSTTIDWNDGNVQEKVLGDNTTFTFTNGNAGATYILVVKQSAGGSNTITWPGSVTWAGASTPTMTATADRYDVYTFIYDGNKYFGSYIQNFI